MDKIKLGFVPTRRSIFSAPDAIKYRGLTADRLREIGVDIVDIDGINDEGLLFDDSHIAPIVEKFRAEGVVVYGARGIVEPAMPADERAEKIAGWRHAVEATISYTA